MSETVLKPMDREIAHLTVDKSYHGARLDKYLRHMLNIPQSLVEKLIRQSRISLETSQDITARTRVLAEQKITIEKLIATKRRQNIPIPATKSSVRLFRQMAVYEDDDMLVLNKIQGLGVQDGSHLTLSVDRILKTLNAQCGTQYRIVHRIDKETTGILLIAKHRLAAQTLTRAFFRKQIQKEYLAVVRGFPKSTSLLIQSPIIHDHTLHAATTLCETLDHCEDLLSLVKLVPKTGRKHQLRIHLQQQQHPVLGDKKYGIHAPRLPNSKNLHLHAWRIKVPKYPLLEAPLPPHFQKTLDDFNLSHENQRKSVS